MGETGGTKSTLKAVVKDAKAQVKDARQRLDELTPAQRDLLMKRLHAKLAAKKSAGGLNRVERTGPVPLSFAQQGFWIADRMRPADPGHVIAGVLRVRGPLRLDALQAALDAVVVRHEPLRSTFRQSADGPVQTMGDPASVPMDVHDIRALEPGPRATALDRLLRGAAARGFDLARDLLLRATVVRLDEEAHHVVLAVHHIAADGWSIGLLVQELTDAYRAHLDGLSVVRPPLSIRYGDFAQWQRGMAEQGGLRAGLDYWLQQLAQAPPVVEPRPDRGLQPSTSGADGGTVRRVLDVGRRQALERTAREHDTTVFATVLCGFMAVLAQWTQQSDIVVGTPVSHRPRLETEAIVGVFLNTVAIRARMEPDRPFGEALGEVRKAVLGGLEHANVPFELVVRELVPERKGTQHPLFATFVNFTPEPVRRLEFGGLSATMERLPVEGAQFPVELYVTERGDGLELELLYRTSLYRPERMEAFVDQLDALLRQACADPTRSIGDFLAPSAGLADASTPLPLQSLVSVPMRLAELARTHGSRVAIESGDWSIDYAELGRRVEAIAQCLVERGMRAGQVVAVSGPRSPGVILAMAGVLRAGGVLLTLSPDLPLQRRRVMASEADARWLLHVGPPPDLAGVPAIGLQPDGTLPTPPQACACPVPDADPKVPAYVFFTSGSTGKPKGVLGNHGGLAHFLSWQAKRFEVGPSHRCAQFVGLSFDVVLRDVFLPLTSGATLVLPVGVDALSGTDVLDWLGRAQITHVHAVPSLLSTWMDGDGVAHALQCVFSAGEPLTDGLVQQIRDRCPNAKIVNLYGPTETTLAKFFYEVPDSPLPGIQPLGQPLPRTQAVVLRPNGRRCGLYEPGEIAIRTPYASLGYLNAPQEQTRRFVANPWGGPGDSLYLTGDSGIVRADGLLEFRGRLDHQVKIGGVRVEPGEVTATLAQCKAVASCAVVAREDAAGIRSLVAYVVAAEGSIADESLLRGWLRDRVPSAMVPAAFVWMDALPLNANHKLDRSKLPEPSGARPELANHYVAPRSGAELEIVRIWQELLDVRPIGVADSFFELGGHSLLALTLLSRLERELGRKIPLASLFERPTVEHLAAVASQPSVSRLVHLQRGASGPPLFLVHPGGGMLWNYVPLVSELDGPIYGLAAHGVDGHHEPLDDIVEIARHYVDEVLQVRPDGPFHLAGHSLGGVIAYEMARQLHSAGRVVALLCLMDSHCPELPGQRAEDGDTDAARLLQMVRAIERFAGVSTDVTLEQLDALDAPGQIDCVVRALHASRALPVGEDGVRIRALMAVGRAHVEARRRYVPPPSPVPMHLVRARANPTSEPALGWASLAPTTVHQVDGDHLTMMVSPHVQAVAMQLAGWLAD